MERLKTLTIAVLIVALAGSIALAATEGTAEVRVTARQLADRRVEFALQQRTDGNGESASCPASATSRPARRPGRWLNSSPLSVNIAVASPAEDDQLATTETPPPAQDYTPSIVPRGDRGTLHESIAWSSTIGPYGHRTHLLITEPRGLSPYRIAFLSLYCDHDSPTPHVWGTTGYVREDFSSEYPP